MVLQNLVFNKLGNSFSALLLYENQSIQLWDDVKTDYFEIKHVCTTEEKPFSVIIKIKEKSFNIYFDKNGFLLKNIKFFVANEGFVINLIEPRYIFELSMAKTSFIKIKTEKEGVKIFIPQQDFFKGLSEFIVLTKL